MDTEIEICARFEAELAAIARLDQAYYLNTLPTQPDRADYAERQSRLEQVRARFYAELNTVRHLEASKPTTFLVRVHDHAIGQTVISAPQCLLAHDLNNYVGVLIGRCELLGDLVKGQARATQHLTAIADAALKITTCLKGSACTRGNSVQRCNHLPIEIGGPS